MSFVHKTFRTYDQLREELNFLKLREIVLESRGSSIICKKELKALKNRIPELMATIEIIENRIKEFADESGKRYAVLFLRIVKRKSNPEIADALDYSVRHVKRICSDFNRETEQLIA